MKVIAAVVVGIAVAAVIAMEPEWQVWRAHSIASLYCESVKVDGKRMDDAEAGKCRARMARGVLTGILD